MASQGNLQTVHYIWLVVDINDENVIMKADNVELQFKHSSAIFNFYKVQDFSNKQ